MSAPIYFVCRAADVPDVEGVNARLAELGYGSRLDETELWPGRDFDAISAVRDGEESTLHLSRDSVRSKSEYIARLLTKVAPQDHLEAEVGRIENQFGDQLIETCYSWSDNGLACAEVHHAVALASSAKLWVPLDRVSADDILSKEDTEQRLIESVRYQIEQTSLRTNRKEQNAPDN